ncbi:MAG: histidinol-phosphate transaminase, partial [Chloroflexota bacterium]
AVELCEALEGYLGVDRGQIAVSNGSDEMLDFLARLFIRPGDKALTAVPTFPMYRFNVNLFDGAMTEVPRNENFDVMVDDMVAAVDDSTKLILIATPNNPTGNSIDPEHVRRLLATGAFVVIDEAYAEFAGTSYVPWVNDYENIAVLRTFSKWAGLAGLRVGYGVFHPSVISWLWRVKPPYTVNVAAQVAAVASLADRDYLMANVHRIVAERERLAAVLREKDYLRVYPSDANYLYIRFTRGDALAVKTALEQRGIFVRYYDEEYLRGGFRITIGKPEHTNALLAALAEITGAMGIA